jgi:hypothetical protein
MDPTRHGRPAITSGSSITPTWAAARSPSQRTNGVETPAHEKPSVSARATPAGTAGHTRPKSAARRGSSLAGAVVTRAL